MVLFLLTGMIAAVPAQAGWDAGIRSSPPAPPTLAVQGLEPSPQVVRVKKRLRLTVQGPGKLELDLYGLQVVRGRRTRGPGKVLVKHTGRRVKKRQHRLTLSSQALEGASVAGRGRRLTQPQSLTLELGPGKNTVVIVARGAPAGLGVVARLAGSGTAQPAGVPEPELAELAGPARGADAGEPELAGPARGADAGEPELAGPAGGPDAGEPELAGPAAGPGAGEPELAGPAGGPDASEPELAGPAAGPGAGEPELAGTGAGELGSSEPALVGDAGAPEPDLLGAGGDPELPTGEASVAPAAGPMFEILGESDTVDVVEPDAVIVFNRVEIDRNLRAAVTGPGTMVFDIHAYRDSGYPESLEPVTVSLLVDDVLIQTHTIDQEPDERYQLLGASHALSTRVALRLPVPPGEHEVTLSVSDEATLGALVRPRFENVVDEPQRVAQLRELTAVDPGASGPAGQSFSRLGLFGGATLPLALGAVGYRVSLGGDYGFSLGRQRFGVGASAGLSQVEVTRTVLDARLSAAPAAVTLTLTTVPAVAVVRWSYSFTEWLDLSLGVGGGALVGWLETTAPGVSRQSRTKVAALGHAEAMLLFRIALGGIALRLAYQPATEISTRHVTPFSPSALSLSAGWVFEL